MQTQRDSCGLHYCLTPEYKQFCRTAWRLTLIVYCSYNMSRFQAYSQSCNKRLLASSLSVRPRAITRLPLDGFSWNFMSREFQFCDYLLRTTLHAATHANRELHGQPAKRCTGAVCGILHHYCKLSSKTTRRIKYMVIVRVFLFFNIHAIINK